MTESGLVEKISWAMSGGLPDVPIGRKTALMVIDVQYVDAHRDGRLGRMAAEAGEMEELEYYFSRLETTALPAMSALIAACRGSGLPVIHTRIMNLAGDSADTSRRYKCIGVLVPPDSPEAEFLPEVSPLPGEVVINKTTSGAFISTNADFVLRNMGIDTLIIVGVVTNNCVETTARDASDLGYAVVLVDDACAAITEEGHDHAMRHLHGNYVIVKSSAEVLEQIGTLTQTVTSQPEESQELESTSG